MGAIQILPDVLASQVAAGEVVERPASVVKELVENSIDAGATKITVEFQSGGRRLIRVSDDGSGMDREDALMCFERHATSKIRKTADLDGIMTLGFRGEAIPSIASVSRLTLTTKHASDDVGTEVKIEGGAIISSGDVGRTTGTTIEVRDLFYNIPARRKFLRTEQTETANILTHLQNLALVNPHILFICIKDGREAFRYLATKDHGERVRDVMGANFFSSLLLVPETTIGYVTVRGWIAKPGEAREDRSQQILFVNNRAIRSPMLSLPLRDATEGFLKKGTHPPAIMFFQIDPREVDVNVHPAKLEVRFRNPGGIRSAAFIAARDAFQGQGFNNVSAIEGGMPARPLVLNTDALTSGFNLPANESFAWVDEPVAPQSVSLIDTEGGGGLGNTETGMVGTPSRPIPIVAPLTHREPENTATYLATMEPYLLFRDNGALVLVQVKAAMERICYEKIAQEIAQVRVTQQNLLLPETVELPTHTMALFESHAHTLAAAGLDTEPFGSNTLKINSIPAMLIDCPINELIDKVSQVLQECGETTQGSDISGIVHEKLVMQISRLAAYGEKAPKFEAGANLLLAGLLKCSMPYATPSGRPTMFQMSPTELARKF